MDKGTIVYTGGFMMPDKNAAAHRVLNNARALSECGFNMVFCGVDNDIPFNAKNPCMVNGFESWPAKYPESKMEWFNALNDISHIISVVKYYKNVVMVIAYNMHAGPMRKLLKYCKSNKIKIVSDITEWYEHRFSIINPIKNIMCYDTWRVMTHYNKKVDGIIAISTYLRNYYHNDVKHIIQIPPLVDTNEPIWHQDTGISDSSLVFVYAGFPGQEKEKDRLDLLLDNFSEFASQKNFKLIIVGVEKDNYLNQNKSMREIIEQLGNKVIFKGKVNHADSIRYLLSADYSVFFRDRSRKNMAGFPTKFAEGITCGIRIIANKVSDIEQYAQYGKCLLVNTVDSKSIKHILSEELHRNEKTVHVLSTSFDYRQFITELNQFVETVLLDI